jgi:hypothetical protein
MRKTPSKKHSKSQHQKRKRPPTLFETDILGAAKRRLINGRTKLQASADHTAKLMQMQMASGSTSSKRMSGESFNCHIEDGKFGFHAKSSSKEVGWAASKRSADSALLRLGLQFFFGKAARDEPTWAECARLQIKSTSLNVWTITLL